MSHDNTHHNGLLVIKASAGSGKTYNLALRYIEQLLFTTDENGRRRLRHCADYHRHILAITFTNKATDEMKRRIVERLHELATNTTDSPYYDNFVGDAAGKIPLQEAAKRALNDILFHYSTFGVSTIDSFFQSILRNFARELDRDYNYAVEIDEQYVMQQAVHRFLLTLGNSPQHARGVYTTIEQWVKNIISEQVNKNEGWDFFNNEGKLASFVENTSSEVFRMKMDDVRNYLNDFSAITTLRSVAVRAHKLFADRYASDYYQKRMADVFLQHGLDAETLKHNTPLYTFYFGSRTSVDKAPSEAHEKLITSEKVNTQFNKDAPVITDSAVSDIIAVVKDTIACYLYANIFDRLVNDLGLLGLLNAINEQLQQYRKETNSLLIADTNELIGRVLESGVPFIYERVGTRLNHYMIDEFQDTSKQQYHNFKDLLDEALAHGEDNFCMLIGDAKQSIYRFRNADVSLFRDEVQRDYPQHLHQNLDTNYRSLPNIIDFNNRFVAMMLSRHGANDINVQHTYLGNNITTNDPSTAEYVQKHHKQNSQGMVRIMFTNSKLKPYNKIDDVLEELPSYLINLHKHFQWKDIGILVNKKSEGKKVVAAILDHNKKCPTAAIRVVSDEAMLLKNSPAVRRLVSLLRFVDLAQFVPGENDDADDLSTATVSSKHLNEQQKCRVLEAFMAQVANHPESETDPNLCGTLLAQCFDNERDTASGTPEQRTQHYARQLREMLTDGLNDLISLTALTERLAQRYILPDNNGQNEQKELAFVMAFHDFVADFCKRNIGATVRELLREWDAKSDSLCAPTSTGDNAIRVMTIHKAKGLEFNCVVLPWANWDISPKPYRSELTWVPKEQWLNQGFAQLLSSLHDPVINNLNEQQLADIVPPLVPMHLSALNKLYDINGMSGNFIGSWRSDTLIDNLNKTYVAFTRPIEELHIFAQNKQLTEKSASGKKKATKKSTQGQPTDGNANNLPDDTINNLLANYLSQVQGIIEVPTAEFNTYVPDIPLNYSPDNSGNADNSGPDSGNDASNAISGNDMPSNSGWWQMGMPRQTPARPSENEQKNTDTLENPYPADFTPAGGVRVRQPEELSIYRQKGLQLHALMSRINTATDADYALRYCLHHGIIHSVKLSDFGLDSIAARFHIDTLDQWLQLLFSLPETAHWFAADNRIYNERGISLGQQLADTSDNADTSDAATELPHADYRPDRIIARPDGSLIVIDYKFGQPRPFHRRQVAKYAQLLQEITGAPVSAVLYYAVSHTIINVGVNQGQQR